MIKINVSKILDIITSLILFNLLVKYSLDLKVIYPKYLVDLYPEPLFKIFLYFTLFFLANINITYAIYYFIFIVFLEFDNLLFNKN
jgi:hypothetical protein